MESEKRKHYLQKLGVQCWTSRYLQPGAKNGVIQVAPKAISEVISDQQEAVEDTFKAMVTVDNGSKVAAPYSPVADPVELLNSPEPAKPGAIPLFNLRFSYYPGECLLIDELPLEPANHSDTLTANLTAEILSSLGGSFTTEAVSRTFSWPLLHNVKIDQGEQVATDAVQAFLKGQLEGRSLRFILLMGQAPQKYLMGCTAVKEVPDELRRLENYPVAGVASTHQMLKVSSLKKHTWKALQPLTQWLLDNAAGR